MVTSLSGPLFRAEHVGSLLRPDALRQAFRAHASGNLDDAVFVAAQDAAIREIVALQESVGLEVITDGEFRRGSYWGRFVERVEGLGVREALFSFHDDGGNARAFTAPHVTGPLRRSAPIALDELAFLRTATRRTPKITLPSPPTMHFWRLGQAIDRGVYASRADCFRDLARVYREELAALAGAGATYVQLDDVPLAMLCDDGVREQVRASGEDPERLLDVYIELFNDALGERPPGLTVAVHLCRGNFKGAHLSAGGYGPVAERVFGGLQADAFLLEYDTARAGDFAPLAEVPPGVRVVLGLISTKTPALEDPDALAARIDAASRHLRLDQLAISPQCGFASTVGGNPLTEDEQRAKLALVVEVAARVWA